MLKAKREHGGAVWIMRPQRGHRDGSWGPSLSELREGWIPWRDNPTYIARKIGSAATKEDAVEMARGATQNLSSTGEGDVGLCMFGDEVCDVNGNKRSDAALSWNSGDRRVSRFLSAGGQEKSKAWDVLGAMEMDVNNTSTKDDIAKHLPTLRLAKDAEAMAFVLAKEHPTRKYHQPSTVSRASVAAKALEGLAMSLATDIARLAEGYGEHLRKNVEFGATQLGLDTLTQEEIQSVSTFLSEGGLDGIFSDDTKHNIAELVSLEDSRRVPSNTVVIMDKGETEDESREMIAVAQNLSERIPAPVLLVWWEDSTQGHAGSALYENGELNRDADTRLDVQLLEQAIPMTPNAYHGIGGVAEILDSGLATDESAARSYLRMATESRNPDDFHMRMEVSKAEAHKSRGPESRNHHKSLWLRSEMLTSASGLPRTAMATRIESTIDGAMKREFEIETDRAAATVER